MVKQTEWLLLALIALPAVLGGRVPRVALPAECRNLDDCDNHVNFRHGAAWSCTDGKCMCHPQAVHDSVNKICICKQGFTKFGNECRGDASPSAGPVSVNATGRGVQCPPCPENAQCGSNGCECNADYVMIDKVCKKAANSVGDPCEYEQQCKWKLGGFSTCSETRCICGREGVAVENNSTCYAKKALGEDCIYLEQCNHVLHGTCSKTLCLCDPGFVEFNKSCIPGKFQTLFFQTATLSNVPSYVDYVLVDKYNEICLEHVQCQNGKLGYGSTCRVDTKKCSCETEFFYHSSKQLCVFARGLNDACDGKNNDCFLPADGDKQNIQCTNLVCQCKKGFKPSEDNQKCVPNAGVVNKTSFFMMAVLLLVSTIRR
ncbi:Uncharacterized protein GBIM_03990 [Gryllus bimaculatus]|nr:Uncharacterized protein GBIM_03990 [Gryllus bimaculatus]